MPIFLNTPTFKELVKNEKFENFAQAQVLLPYLLDTINELSNDLNDSVSKARVKREIAWQSDGESPETVKALIHLSDLLEL
jgi:hypothetical protein